MSSRQLPLSVSHRARERRLRTQDQPDEHPSPDVPSGCMATSAASAPCQCADLLREFSLEEAADCYPRRLSGGMQRRVAIARAMIMQPEVVFLDEPFTGLDEETNYRLQRFLLRLNLKAKQEQGSFAGVTMVIVTHELNAGLTVADRVIGLSQYWDWKAAGFETCPGATIVYDKPASVYGPDDTVNIADLETQKREIEDAVSSPEFRESRERFRREWSVVREQQPTGALSGVRE